MPAPYTVHRCTMDLVALAMILTALVVASQILHAYFFRKPKPVDPKPIVFPRTKALLRWYNVRHVNAIVDQFKSVQEVGEALHAAGLDHCRLMFGK